MNFQKFNVFIESKIKPYKKSIKVDSDKSLSIRSFLLGSISNGVSIIKNILESDDVKGTIAVCRKLGIKITKIKSNVYKIYGKGVGSFYSKENTKLYLGNSGTLARLLIGILSTTPNIKVKLSGDKSLNKRNMRELYRLMYKFGATFLPKNKFTFPIKLISSAFPIGINYKAGESAQLKSAVILAGLNSYGNTTITEQVSSRNHTENLLKKNSKTIKILNKNKKKIIKVFGKNSLNAINISIGGDPSSAAFFATLTLLNNRSSIKIKNVGLNPTRIGFYKILKENGAKIKFINLKKHNNEITGDIIVNSCKVGPIKTLSKMYPSTTDEYLLLFLIASLQNGVSSFKGISGLANKESSRAYEMKKILKQIGVKSKLSRNELKIYGKGMINPKNKKIKIENLGDHRVAMCAFILAVLTNTNTYIKNFETVFTSFPSFLKIMKFLGAKFEIHKQK